MEKFVFKELVLQAKTGLIPEASFWVFDLLKINTNYKSIRTFVEISTLVGNLMFIGEYSHAIDQKGRMAIPSKMRRDIGSGAVVTRGIDNCLWLFPRKEWQELAQKLSSLPLSDSNSRAFARLMLAGAMEVEFDSQGRALLPLYLRNYAGLKKNAIVAGLYNRLEIWDASKWADYKQRTEKATDQIAKHMADLGV